MRPTSPCKVKLTKSPQSLPTGISLGLPTLLPPRWLVWHWLCSLLRDSLTFATVSLLSQSLIIPTCVLPLSETWADGDTAQPAGIGTYPESHIWTYTGKLLSWPYHKLWAIIQMKKRVNDKRKRVLECISYRIQGTRKWGHVWVKNTRQRIQKEL